MITKVTKLHGIGTLHAPLTSGALTLKKKTIIFGENGRGKTTFVALLRSLATGEASPLRQRKSIKGVHPQVAQILIDQFPYDLKDGQWAKAYPQISFFDALFIDENVYTGTTVVADHRKNLLSFALGEEGVKLARKVDGLAGEISNARTAETQVLGNVQPFIAGTMSPERFIKLEPVGENAQAGLQEKRRIRDALLRASALEQLQTLSPIQFEEISLPTLNEILERSLEDISRVAEAKIRDHLSATNATEEWIAEGTTFNSGDCCPYCAQDLRNSEIAPIYCAYFSAAYREFKATLKSNLEALEKSYDAPAQTNLRSAVEGNRSRLLQWRDFLPETKLDFDIKDAVGKIEAARIALEAAASRKTIDPFERTALTPDELARINAVGPIATKVDDYNAAEVEINETIQKLRNSTKTGNLDQAQIELSEFENRITRYTEEAKAACDVWANATKKRENLEAEKAEARKQLDDYTSSVLSKYREAINRHLKACGTSFRISTLKTSYQGGTARCEYGIELFGVPVDLANKPLSPITFDSAMSQGDKGALAFAFFLARLESDPSRPGMIVVFDDPLSSLDGRRRRYTRNKIAELSDEVAQTIVLTHEEATVADIACRVGESDCSLFELREEGDYSAFAPATVKEITANEYSKCFDNLTHFLDGNGKPEEVVKAVRPYLEMNLRYRFPDELKADPLGKMIGQIRSADSSKALSRLALILKELEEINDFCTKHSHGDGALTNTERMLASDLKAVVGGALEISRGFPIKGNR